MSGCYAHLAKHRNNKGLLWQAGSQAMARLWHAQGWCRSSVSGVCFIQGWNNWGKHQHRHCGSHSAGRWAGTPASKAAMSRACPAGKWVGNAFSKNAIALCNISLFPFYLGKEGFHTLHLKWLICFSVLSNGACTCVCSICMCMCVWVCIYVCVSMCVLYVCACVKKMVGSYVCVLCVCVCLHMVVRFFVYGVCMCVYEYVGYVCVCMCTCVYMSVWVCVVFGSVCHIFVSMCVCLCVLYGVCMLYVVSWENKRANAFVMRL